MTQKDYTLLADTIAREAHKGQTRNDKQTPYYTHPLAVEKIAVRIAEQHISKLVIAYEEFMVTREDLIEFVRQVAKLHDVVEDTSVTLEYLKSQGFHPIVIDGVARITKHPVKGAESYLDYLFRVIGKLISRIVKLADLEHNMSDLKPGNMYDKYVLAKHFLAINT